MLVLSRKVGESIHIDGDIRVTVSQVRGGRVRLSITAPAAVRVVREEILQKFGIPQIEGVEVASEDLPDADAIFR
ncbi:MAG: carbon storage regulator [Planctomycetaceae bacterium]|jgi:carbon storage regulator